MRPCHLGPFASSLVCTLHGRKLALHWIPRVLSLISMVLSDYNPSHLLSYVCVQLGN